MTTDDTEERTRVTPISSYGADDPTKFQAFRLSDGRRAGFCWDEKPRCVGRAGEPFGHRFRPKDPELFKTLKTETIARCQHRLEREGTPCGALLYMAVMSFGGSAKIKGTGERCLFVVEVTDAMVKEMGTVPMTFLETLALIDVVLPGVLLDVGVPRELEDREAFQQRIAAEAERRAKERE